MKHIYTATYVCALKRTRAISSYIGASCRCDMCVHPIPKHDHQRMYMYDEIQQKASAHISFIFLHPLLKIFKYKNPLYWICVCCVKVYNFSGKMCAMLKCGFCCTDFFFFLQKSQSPIFYCAYYILSSDINYTYGLYTGNI